MEFELAERPVLVFIGSRKGLVRKAQTQRLQNPLIEEYTEYTLNYNRSPNKIYSIFLNYRVLESLGTIEAMMLAVTSGAQGLDITTRVSMGSGILVGNEGPENPIPLN